MSADGKMARLREIRDRARKASADLGRIRETIEDPYASRLIWLVGLIAGLVAGLIAALMIGLTR